MFYNWIIALWEARAIYLFMWLIALNILLTLQDVIDGLQETFPNEFLTTLGIFKAGNLIAKYRKLNIICNIYCKGTDLSA